MGSDVPAAQSAQVGTMLLQKNPHIYKIYNLKNFRNAFGRGMRDMVPRWAPGWVLQQRHNEGQVPGVRQGGRSRGGAAGDGGGGYAQEHFPTLKIKAIQG